MTFINSSGLLPSVTLTTALYLILQHARTSMWRLALLTLPGTFAHELAHWVVGILLLAKPTRFSLWPQRAGGGWTLGSVTFRGINLFNGAFVALAPLLFFPLAWLGLIRVVAPFWARHRWGWWFLGSYLLATILFAALPSLQDMKEGRRSIFLYGTIGGIWWFLGGTTWRTWFN